MSCTHPKLNKCISCKEMKYTLFPFYCNYCWLKKIKKNRITNYELYDYLSKGTKLYLICNLDIIDLGMIYNLYKAYIPSLYPFTVILDKILFIKEHSIKSRNYNLKKK